MSDELKEREVFEAHMRVGGYSNHDKHPDGSYVSSAMELWWQGWKARAQLPSQGGEAVEVVAWQDAENPLYTTAERRVMHDWAGNGYPIVELMTVTQHQRILAASAGSAEPVAWHTEDHLTDKSATTYDPEIAKRWRAKGWPVTPLYTHPADQVAQPDAELVRQCISQELATWEGDFKGPVHTAMRCLQVRIDAKLASLKGVEE